MAMTIRTAVASRHKGKDMFDCEDMFEGMSCEDMGCEDMGKSGFERGQI
jgi:hypothetical protein